MTQAVQRSVLSILSVQSKLEVDIPCLQIEFSLGNMQDIRIILTRDRIVTHRTPHGAEAMCPSRPILFAIVATFPKGMAQLAGMAFIRHLPASIV